MKRFINYLEGQNKLIKTQLYVATFGILLFLTLAITLPNYLLKQQQDIRSRAQVASTPIPIAAIAFSITRSPQKTILGLRNVYSPQGVMQDGTFRLYYGGWIQTGQVHDDIYRSTCITYDSCGTPQTVLDSAALGFEHLNDPAIVKMPGGYYIMYMTGVAAGDNGLIASNNHIYYSTSWTNDGVNWSTPVKLISKHWLPSATIGPAGHIYLYANDNSINGQVVRFDLGASGIEVGTPQMVTLPTGKFYSNVDVMYRPALGFYQIFAEYHRADGSGAIDYLDSTDGLTWNLVHPDVVIPDASSGEKSVGSPAPHPDTHGIVYFGSTAQADSMGFKIRVQTWQSLTPPPPTLTSTPTPAPSQAFPNRKYHRLTFP